MQSVDHYLAEILLQSRYLPVDYWEKKPTLTTPAIFDELSKKEIKEYWSLSFVPVEILNASKGHYLCDLWPMMETFPKELAYKGAKFTLILGDKIVGDGIFV